MTAKIFEHFMLRIYDDYVEISKSTRGDAVDVDLFELWDYLEETLQLPVPVLTTHSKCYSATPEAQLQFSQTAKKYYSAIAVIDTNNIKNEDNDFFLEDVPIKNFASKDDAIAWLKAYGPVKELE